MCQRIVDALLGDSGLAAHYQRLRETYRRRRDAMLAALAAYFPSSARWETPQGGMFIWVDLPPELDADALLPDAAARGALYVPGSAFFVATPRRNCLRLSYTGQSEAAIAEGIKRLGALMHEKLDAR